jgi:hypothetical protein
MNTNLDIGVINGMLGALGRRSGRGTIPWED